MGSIRPLFTITVLVVVGAYLYVKINEGPAHPHAHSHDGHDHEEGGVPPLAAAGGGATLAQDTTAPAWPAVESKNASATPPFASMPALPAAGGSAPSAASTNISSANSDATKNALPEVPPIPELPEMPQTTDAAPPATQPATPPGATPMLELPKNVPTAQYDNGAGPNLGSGALTGEMPGALPVLPTLPGEMSATTPPVSPVMPPTNTNGAASSATNILPVMPNSNAGTTGSMTPAPSSADRYGSPAASPAAATAPSAPAMPATDAPPPNPPMIPAIPAGVQIPDRYGVGASVTPQPPAVTPLAGQPNVAASASFAASWPAIQAALDRRDLKQAHQLLSKWHGDETLSPADAQKVETLLGQLAGTVIYSTEHQLEPARIVKPGETLEAIAKEYNVPWQLLAKINSIPAPDQVRPGQELKVVRGPFSAVVDLHRSELTLEVDGRYAGTFPVSIPPGAAAAEGQWLVDQKLVGGPNLIRTATNAGGLGADRTIVLRNAASAGAAAGSPMLTIASNPAPGSSPAIGVAPQDAEELSDILSVGSRVIVRR